jgi:ABC-type phosphate/phosphonate transport system permease subunit
VYSADSIDEQLADATCGFLDGNTEIKTAEGVVTLSMLFSWYRQDFGSTDREVIAWVKDHASPELKEKIDGLLAQCPNPAISYATYNWDLNS